MMKSLKSYDRVLFGELVHLIRYCRTYPSLSRLSMALSLQTWQHLCRSSDLSRKNKGGRMNFLLPLSVPVLTVRTRTW